MVQYWQKAINLGCNDSLHISELTRTRLLNKLAVVTLIVSTILLIARYFTNSKTILPSFIAIGLVLGILNLNHKKLYRTARIVSSFAYPFAIALIIMEEGGSFGEFLIFIDLVILTFILLDNNKLLRNLCLVWINLLALGSYLYIVNSFNPNPIGSNVIGSLLMFVACVVVLCFLILFYQKEINYQQKIQDQLLSKLQKKNLELERFAFISSHDLKVPLHNIIGFSKLTNESIKEADYKSAHEFIEIINKNATRMNQLIRDTLEMISYNNLESTKSNVDLNIIFDQITELISGTIKNNNVTITKMRTLPSITGAKPELFSCFKNLIENAIKYNSSPNPIIEIDYIKNSGHNILTFKDNGIGIDKKQYKNIFEMYQRLVRQDQYEGTGLGLPICKKIIENCGGKIWVESQVGKGSTFFIQLPKVNSSHKKEAVTLKKQALLTN